MPVTRVALSVLGVALLTGLWLGPLPALARHSFAAHMTMHMGVVALAAPLLALAIAGSAHDPVRRTSAFGIALLASVIELVVVWGWHAPAMHQAARRDAWTLVLEQGSFLVAGTTLWLAAFGGDSEQRRLRAGSGMTALLLTSMHMTLLGALFALANRPLFQHTMPAGEGQVLADQHLGGAIMLIAGGASYLAGGLWLAARMLRDGRTGMLVPREPAP
jgi:putative membrane protein